MLDGVLVDADRDGNRPVELVIRGAVGGQGPEHEQADGGIGHPIYQHSHLIQHMLRPGHITIDRHGNFRPLRPYGLLSSEEAGGLRCGRLLGCSVEGTKTNPRLVPLKRMSKCRAVAVQTRDALDEFEQLSKAFSAFDDCVQAYSMFKYQHVSSKGADHYIVTCPAIASPFDAKAQRTMSSTEKNIKMARLAADLMLIGQEHQLDLKIGLHCGTCVGAVVGNLRAFYCVYGDTINMAARIRCVRSVRACMCVKCVCVCGQVQECLARNVAALRSNTISRVLRGSAARPLGAEVDADTTGVVGSGKAPLDTILASSAFAQHLAHLGPACSCYGTIALKGIGPVELYRLHGAELDGNPEHEAQHADGPSALGQVLNDAGRSKSGSGGAESSPGEQGREGLTPEVFTPDATPNSSARAAKERALSLQARKEEHARHSHWRSFKQIASASMKGMATPRIDADGEKQVASCLCVTF